MTTQPLSPLTMLLSRHTRRREFITLLGGAAAMWPMAAQAQQPAKLPTIGFLGGTTPSTMGEWVPAFVQRLRELGWIEGRTVAIEYRWAEGRSERFAEVAAEFVRLKVDVIVTAGGRSPRGKAGDIGHPDRLRCGVGPGWRRPRREPGATGRQCHWPVAPVHRSCWQANRSSCANLSPALADWPSWPILAIPPPCWRWARFRQWHARSASRSPHWKSGERRTSRPLSRRSRAVRRHFMSLPTRS